MTTTAIDEALAPFVRQALSDIMDEISLADLNLDELCDLLELMTAVRQRIRTEPRAGGKVVTLKLVRPAADEVDGQTR
jgi:hypothetical protein